MSGEPRDWSEERPAHDDRGDDARSDHRDSLPGKVPDQVPDVLLDSAHTGGEVVRDHEDSRDLHRYTTP